MKSIFYKNDYDANARFDFPGLSEHQYENEN